MDFFFFLALKKFQEKNNNKVILQGSDFFFLIKNKQNTLQKCLGSNETFMDFSVLKIEANLGLKHFKWKHVSNGKIEILAFKSGK